MEEILRAIVLGIIQGLTEFLPVSSSGHLEILKYLFGYDGTGHQSLTLTVMLHAATALSTVVVFWKDILSILKDVLKFEWNSGSKFAFWIVISMIPAAIIGILFEEQLEVLFEGQILFVACMLIVTAALLILAERLTDGSKPLNNKNVFVVGLAQAFAILPGVSRSGATIATGLMLGLGREQAARFSFLMVLPLIFGKVAKDILSGDIVYEGSEIMPLICGTVAAFIVGVIACRWMISIVKQTVNATFEYFCMESIV